MADVAKLMVKVGADIGDAQKGLKQVHSDVQGATTSMNSLGQASALALGGLLVAGAAAAAAGLGFAAVSAMKFEQTMSGVKAVSGASATEMTQLNALALQLGKDTVFSAAQAGQGLEELVKGGVSIDNIMGGAAKAVLNLASAGGVDLKSAAEIAANAMSMFNLTGADMAHVTDQIAGAANASSLDVQDFRLSLQAVGAVANLTGQSFDSTAVAIAVMGAAGIKGSDAGTSLKTMLMNLQPQTDKAREMFDQLGITVNGTGNKFIDANGNFKETRDIAGILQTALGGLTKADQEMALQVMFGTDAIRAGAIMAKAGSEGFDTMAGSMSKVTAESVAAERLNNLAGDLEQLKGSAETLAISFGTQLTPKLREVTQAGTKFLNEAIDRLPDAMRDAETAMAGLNTKFRYFADAGQQGSKAGNDFNKFLHDNSTALSVAGAAAATAGGLYLAFNIAAWAGAAALTAHTAATWLGVTATGAMTGATAALNAVMALNPIALVVITVAALAAGLVIAYNTSSDFRNIWNDNMGAASAAAANFVNSVSSFLGSLIDNLQSVINQAANVVSALGGIPRRVDVSVVTTYTSVGGQMDQNLAANPDAGQLASMYRSSDLNIVAQADDAKWQRTLANMAAIDNAETADSNAYIGRMAAEEKATNDLRISNSAARLAVDDWGTANDAAAASLAKVAVEVPKVSNALAGGGGGGGSGGGGGGGGLAGAADAAGKAIKKALEDAADLASKMGDFVNTTMGNATEKTQAFGDAWIAKWFEVNDAIQKAKSDATAARDTLTADLASKAAIDFENNALDERLNKLQQVHDRQVEDATTEIQYRREVAALDTSSFQSRQQQAALERSQQQADDATELAFRRQVDALAMDSFSQKQATADTLHGQAQQDEYSLWTLNRELGNASTQAEKDAIMARFADQSEVVAYQRVQADEDRAWSLSQGKARLEEEHQIALADISAQREIETGNREWQRQQDLAALADKHAQELVDIEARRVAEDVEAKWVLANITLPRAFLAAQQQAKEVAQKYRDIDSKEKQEIDAINHEWDKWQLTEADKLAKAIADAKTEAAGTLNAWSTEFYKKLPDEAKGAADQIKAIVDAALGSSLSNLGSGGGPADAASGDWAASGGTSGTDPNHAPGGDVYEAWLASGSPSYGEGGIVPGSIGQPQFAVVHGGEVITTPNGASNPQQTINLVVDGKVLATVVAQNLPYVQARRV